MADTTVFLSRLGMGFDHLPEKQRHEATAALTAAHEAQMVTVNADAALIASLPPHEVQALRMFHANDTATLAAAWRATVEYRASRMERERNVSEKQQKVAASTPSIVALSWRRP